MKKQTHFIGSFELLFQKAGTRSLLCYDNLEFKRCIIELPNIVYCYSVELNALLVVATDAHVTSLDEILRNQEEEIYGFDLPNMNNVYFSNGLATIGICINGTLGELRPRIYNVQEAATYFLNSAFSKMPCFDIELFYVYGARPIKIYTFGEFFKHLER